MDSGRIPRELAPCLAPSLAPAHDASAAAKYRSAMRAGRGALRGRSRGARGSSSPSFPKCRDRSTWRARARSGRRCGCGTGQPWATWCISRAFGASSARGRTGRRLVRRELHLAQLVEGVVRHNVVGPMVHGKRLDVLDSGRDEFGARERAGNRLMAGPVGHTRRCVGPGNAPCSPRFPNGATAPSRGTRARPLGSSITPQSQAVARPPSSGPRNVVRAPPDQPSAGSRPAPAPQTHRGHYPTHLRACRGPSVGLRYVARRPQPVVRDVAPAKPAAGWSSLAHTTRQRRGKRAMLSQLVPCRNRTFSRSARAPSRFVDHGTWGSLGKSSLERPVIGYEAPHAPLSSRIHVLPRRSRRARALD